MKVATTAPRDQEVIYHQYKNTTECICQINTIIERSEQSLNTTKSENNGFPVLLRWISSTGKLVVPANGEEVTMAVGEYLIGYKNKKLEVVSSRYFREYFKVKPTE